MDQRRHATCEEQPTSLTYGSVTHRDHEQDQTTSITLAWTAPSHDALTSYRIWRGATADSMTVLVQDADRIATTYSHATTESDNTYVYAVTALSLDGCSHARRP